ncbi:MAG: VOC family protein [Candidatus Neomarinimicrobiota bacterium]
MKPHFILFVSDQEKSTRFYETVLAEKAVINVPGMTEFKLNDKCRLGLMPAHGIKKLLGDKLPDIAAAQAGPRVELYLLVENPEKYNARALKSGAKEISKLKVRDWGHKAAYCLDPDGHLLVFAEVC